ncbi:MAG: tRNA preQ1(34) S-adenosylmethionine ribosyltransferase-isomerase QueA [Elusimicrobiota bacterium]|jgi:S-adenosylmethionine:tRNA ribosyltransferase-isomerase|nr:tRNA preQ1(34) S-adenosylmethionine ribosyltransferase-isomerase QueA [Elusimicrobiota bacterium]
MAFERFKKFNIDELIAKNPAEPRDSSRLMVLNRKTKTIEHKIFYDLPNYLKAGDTIIINNSKVFPAKIFATKETGGKIELLLVHPLEDKSIWAVLVREYKPGVKLTFEDGLTGEIIGNTENGEALIKFNTTDILPYARKYGHMPLPPYIEKARKHAGLPKEIITDKEKYQTVYAAEEGSIAAPTAGFHFTQNLLDKIKAMGVNIAYITLHVGWGTFKPLRTEPSEHKMLAELAEISSQTADIINKTKQTGGRLIAVGTTSTRTLESFTSENGTISPGQKWTNLFIYQGYKFKAVDTLITNFHFPDSTPLCLASAFASEDFIYSAYTQAVAMKYRFYSFGDAMLIL